VIVDATSVRNPFAARTAFVPLQYVTPPPKPGRFFGKLPCKGDFLQRRVPQLFLEAWDPMVAGVCAREPQGPAGEVASNFLTSPLWRFVADGLGMRLGSLRRALAPQCRTAWDAIFH